jgi:XRE family transcriptional regulator, regulator of sulfur utilization
VNPEKVIGENIRTMRRAKGWTQETLARKCRMNSDHISTIELGTVNVSIITLIRIARALKSSVAELIKGAE